MKKFFVVKIICMTMIILCVTIWITTKMQRNIGIETSTMESMEEEELKGIVAKEIDMSKPVEVIKAQCVIARTNQKKSKSRHEVVDGLSKEERIELWGIELFPEYENKLEQCIEDTKNVVMTCDGNYIDARYHKISAGYTRDGEENFGKNNYTYLQRADSREDLSAENAIIIKEYSLNEFQNQLESRLEYQKSDSLEEFWQQFKVKARDSSGYVLEVQIGDKMISGTDMAKLFYWPSPCFYMKEANHKISVQIRGVGEGFGLSQAGAERLADKGYSWKDILKYYYSDIFFE